MRCSAAEKAEKKSAGADPHPQPADSLPVFRNPHLLLEIEADKTSGPYQFSPHVLG